MSLELELPRQLDSAAAARHAVDGLASTIGADVLGDVRLLVSELVTNSLRHAELGPEDKIVLGVDLEPAHVRVDVTDSGKGFEFKGPSDDPDHVEGWGLYLVATLADRWGVDRDGGGAHQVWFELDR